MSTPKTRPTNASVSAFLGSLEDADKRRDARRLLALMREETGERAKMWGESIVGFGSYHYRYASGREGDWPITGFSPRKQNFAIYIMPGFTKYAALMARLGKFKTGKSCLYVKRLEDVSENVLRRLVRRSVADMRKLYPNAHGSA
ncbi:MAG: DUF1801 domain-containing protein [Gammaproteobacteria bacterium]|nr:DUF1801 domain-containing protein [Gammaproteobacteria bacterium]